MDTTASSRGADSSAQFGWEREALERAAVGVLLIDAGRIVYANACAAALLGRPLQDLVGIETATQDVVVGVVLVAAVAVDVAYRRRQAR